MSKEESGAPRRALVVAAHPDDPDFGAAGTAATWTREGWEFYYLVCTDGSKGTDKREISTEELIRVRREEQRDAAGVLGVKDVFFLDYQDGELQYTDTRTDNHFHFGGEHNRWDTTGLAPGGHLVRFVVVDTAGMRSHAEVKVCVGEGSCELPQPFHGDPADQMLVATARQHGAILVTRDQRIRRYRHVQSVW